MEGKMMELVFLKAQAMKLTNFVKKKASALGISFEVFMAIVRGTRARRNPTNTVSN